MDRPFSSLVVNMSLTAGFIKIISFMMRRKRRMVRTKKYEKSKKGVEIEDLNKRRLSLISLRKCSSESQAAAICQVGVSQVQSVPILIHKSERKKEEVG